MPRQPRIHLDDIPLHLVQRGHNRQPCFFEPADYHCYLHMLDDALRRCQGRLHAYALMTNHVHLLLTPAVAARVPNVMMAIGRGYVQFVNRKYGRTGTLWDGRYHASLVQSDRYLLACCRYIEMNPVRAGLASRPDDYPWTSFHANALQRKEPRIVPHPLWVELAASPDRRSSAYRALFDEGSDEVPVTEIRRAIRQSQPLGGKDFDTVISRLTGRERSSMPRGRPRTRKIEPDPIFRSPQIEPDPNFDWPR